MMRHFYQNEKFVFLLFVMLSFFAFSPSEALAQALKTDGAVPTLDACGTAGTFTVTIAKGANACGAGTLQIALPATGFEYIAGSAKIGGTALAETNVTTAGATLTLPLIAAGPAAELVTITYQAKATCEAIPMATLPDEQKPTVTYTLNGCSDTPQTGQSDIINVNFAVLKVEVTPNASQGVIGSSITRTIKVTNNGNGSINSFTLERTLGASLAVTSVVHPTGWTVTTNNPNTYTYTGATLAPGAVATLTETVQINSCTALQTTFETYYGCVDKCILGNANGLVTAGVSIDQSIKPLLQITANVVPKIVCFNQEYEHVWTIKNNGTSASSLTKLFIVYDGATSHFGSYFNENSITVGGLPVSINPADTQVIPNTSVAFGTAGKIRRLSINIPDLAPGESREIRFKQYYAAPVADCTKDPNEFYRTYTAYSGTYKNRDGCNADGTNPDIVLPFNQVNNAVRYGFNGTNIGEVDITTSYNADFKLNQFEIPAADLNTGAYFDITLQLSPSLVTGFDPLAIKLIEPISNNSIVPIITDLGGGKYRLRINSGTATWPTNTSFNAGGYRLQFPVNMDCSLGTQAYYTVTGQLNNGGGCTALIQFACQTVNLNAHCGSTCVEGGLDNGNALLKRMTYGQRASSPDNGTPDLSAPAVDPNNPPADFATRFFIGTDKLQISQSGKVVHGTATPVAGWIAGTFSVASPADLKAVAVPNTGKVTITRGAAVYTVTGLPINTSVANNFSIDLSIANLLLSANNLPNGFVYLDDDVIVSSLEIQPMELINSATGIKEFPTTYHLSKAGVPYACASNFRATGYYGPTWLQFFQGGDGKVKCDPTITNLQNANSFLFLFREIEYSKNQMFPNEFRQVARPTKAIFTMPAGLQLHSVRIDINNNSISGNLSKTIVLPTPISSGTYTLDVKQAIIDLKGGNYLDEGWEVRVFPIVQPTCKSTGLLEQIIVEGFMEGTFWHRFPNYQEVQFRNTPEVSIGTIPLNYQTDNQMLTATLTQANSNATSNQAKWVVQVTNASSYRTFGNVWMGQTASTGANVVAMQQVTDLNGTTTIGASLSPVNGIFQLGNFNSGASGNRYYLVTADYSSCDPGNVTLSYGSDCNGYPTSVGTATCSQTLTTLSYTPVFANLQTSIVSQNAGTARPKLCERIPYEIQVNNAGLGDANSLVVTVPLPVNGGLNYVPGTFELTNAFAATAGTYAFVTDASVNVSAASIVFNIPAANVPLLKNGEKFRLKFALTTQGCTFQSGQRISFSASGKNNCGSAIINTNAASSNRVTIDGAPTNLPELGITLSSAVVNLVTSGTALTANYNFTLKNIGDGINNYPATTAYSFNIKLPTGWVFTGNPQDLVPVSKASYVGLDPVKGYVFNLTQDLVVGAEIKIVNATMVYENAASMACDTDFGPIYESAFTIFAPISLCTGSSCQIEQLIVDNENTVLIAPKPIAPTGAANQTFCLANAPTLADIVLTNTGILTWYNSATSTTALPPATPLVNGQVYYVANQLVEGSVCESARFAVTATVNPSVTLVSLVENCAPSGLNYKLVITVNGTAPFVATGATGTWAGNVWTSADITAGTAYDINFTDANNCAALNVKDDAPLCCVFSVTCPTFPATMVTCYADLPSKTSYTEAEFEALGNGDGLIGNIPCGLIVITASNSANTGNCNQTVTRTYTITEYKDDNNNGIKDASENTIINSTTCTQAITVDDKVAPTGTAPVGTTDINSCFINATTAPSAAPAFNATNAAAGYTDNCNGSVTATLTNTTVTGDNCAWTLVYTFSVADACGNTLANQKITYTGGDKTAPTGTAPTGTTGINACFVNATTVPVGTPAFNATSAAAAYTDNCAAIVTATLTETAVTGNNCAWTVTYTFSVADACGNVLTDQKIMHTGGDKTAPTGTAPQGVTDINTCYVNSSTVPAGVPAFNAIATAAGYTDNCSGTVTATLNSTTVAGDNCAWSVTYTFTVADACGNELANQKIVHTGGDRTAPTGTAPKGITGINACYVSQNTIPTGTPAFDAVKAAAGYTDNCGSILTAFLTNTKVSRNNCDWTVTYTFSVADQCGNTLTDQTISHTGSDQTAPTFVGTLPANTKAECGAIPVAPVLTATDNCSIATVTFTETKGNSGGCGSAIVRTWTATDACGNKAIHTQTITVEDHIAPVFTGTLPGNITVNCDQVPAAATVTASDNCGSPEVLFNEVKTAGSCANEYILTRTWTATDICGNAITHTQIIRVEDKTPPVFVGTLPRDIKVGCDAIPAAPVLTATDNCGSATVVFSEVRTVGTCEENGFIITRTWIATDACGNTTIHQQVITVENTSPAITVEKTADLRVVREIGDVIRYTIVVTNTGNLTLRNVKVTDPLTGLSETIAVLAPGEKKTFTTTYVVKLADFNSAKIINIVTAIGTDPKGNPVKDDDTEEVLLEPLKLNIPNVITPNGDGKNDTFRIDGLEAYPEHSLLIFNRWNNEVYNSNGYYRNNWSGEGLNDGTYYYLLKIKNKSGVWQALTGYITLLRKN